MLFALISLLAGALLVAITPPLRGPDESQHFLRAYGITQGDLVPRTLDSKGHKGLYIPARIERELTFFEDKRFAYRTPGFTYWSVFAAHAERAPLPANADTPVFVLYGGAEGYSPVSYLPYAAAIAIGRAAHLDFLAMLYLMRVFGLVTFTAVAAFAIVVVPRLKWAFLAIALLPSALYSRAVVSADGPSLACAMMAVALMTRGVLGPATDRPWHQALWLALGALTKPPQLALVLLALMKWPARTLSRRWKSAALLVLPAVILTGAWTIAGGADAASYRLTAFMTDVPPEQFDPIWKLGYMLRDPLLFPTLLIKSFIDYGVPLWHQVIGVLNWLDTPLAGWTYPVLTALLLASFFGPLDVDRATGRRIALASALAVLGYCFAVFFIFFLVWTTLDATQIDGVQGRYFVPALPAAALGTAALVRRGFSGKIRAAIALGAAVLSCAAAFQAVLRVDWNW